MPTDVTFVRRSQRKDSMRYALAIAAAVTLGTSFSNLAGAQSLPLVRTVARHVSMQDFEVTNFKYQCPGGYIPISYSFTPRFPYDLWEQRDFTLTDRSGSGVTRSSISSAAQIDGGGYSVTMDNVEHHEKQWEALVTCLAMGASSDNTFAFPTGSSSVPKLSYGVANAFCPPDFPVAMAGYSNADGRSIKDYGSAPLWGTSADPITLGSLAEGTAGPPTGWQVKVYNTSFSATVPVTSTAVCGKAPSLQTYVYSAPIPSAVFGVRTPFTVFAPVPDGWTAVGSGYDGGQFGDYSASDLWMQDGNIVNAQVWYLTTKGYDSGSAEVRAFMTQAGGNAPGGSGARAVMAVLAIPRTGPPPTTVNIVEFYHAGLDHYFITAFPQEISDLDSGVHQGWARTGQTFTAYGIGSTGHTGRRPVCREYGNPANGLDSHFYSASPEECIATLLNFGGSWILEATEVFEMDLPDPITGACPAGGVPIYRIFNQRKDANHRYTTSVAIRDQMVARGGVAEGYGPNAVALCGLP
jgi:hypothetical protein